MGRLTTESIQLNTIHDGDPFFSSFKCYAFAGTRFSDYKELQPIGMQIAKRLGGLPLVAKTIIGQLKSILDERY